MRKKFTMLLMTLLAFSGAMKAQITSLDDLSNEAVYIIASERAMLMYTETNGEVLSTSSGANAAAFDANDKNQQFQIKKEGDNYYLFSVGAGKYVSLGGTLVDTKSDDAVLTIRDESEGHPDYPWHLRVGIGTGGTHGLNCQWPGQKLGISVNTWVQADAGNCFFIRPVEYYNITISTEYYYQIKNVSTSRMLSANATNAIVTSTGSQDDLSQLWAFEVSENGYYLRNMGQRNKYLVHVGENNAPWLVSAEKDKFEVIMDYKVHYVFDAYDSSDGIDCAHDRNAADGTISLVRWYGSESASKWILVRTEVPTSQTVVDCKYVFEYNGEVKYTQESAGIVGREWPAIDASQIPFGVEGVVKPVGNIEASDVVDGVATKKIEYTINLPFQPADSYKDIEHWYYMNIRDDDPTYMYYTAGVDYIKADASNYPNNKDERDSYTWAFVGNPFDGISIVNLAAGETMVLSAPSVPTGNAKAEELARMVPTTTEVKGNLSWDIKPTTHTDAPAGAFYVQHPTANSYAFNRQSYNQTNTVCYWNLRDTGSALQVIERPMGAKAELLDLIEKAGGYDYGTGVGEYTEATVTAIREAAAIAQAKIDADETITDEDVDVLQTVIDQVVFNLPDAKKFYVIKSAMPEGDSRSGKKIYVNNNGGMNFEDATTMAHVFQFVDAGDNTFYLKSVERGTYLSTNKAHNGGQQEAKALDTGDAKPLAIARMGRDNVVSLTPVGGAMIHAQEVASSVVAWDNNSNTGASAWIIEEVSLDEIAHTVTISAAAQWSTLVLGYNATIPTGVKAYAVTATGDSYATLAEVTGTIPAGEAVLLNAEGITENTPYAFKYAESATDVEGNLLVGTTLNTNIEETDAYVLSMPTIEGEVKPVGLYKAALNVSTETSNDGTAEEPAVTYEAFLNNAFKAYLVVEGANAPMFSFDRGEGTTGIENSEVTTQKSPLIYDLLGRRVEKMEKGIYIVNGKKVIR